jgi:hypothetical protein
MVVLREMAQERGLTVARATKKDLITMLFEYESAQLQLGEAQLGGAKPAQLREATEENLGERKLQSLINECRTSKEKLDVIL